MNRTESSSLGLVFGSALLTVLSGCAAAPRHRVVYVASPLPQSEWTVGFETKPSG